VDGVRYRFKGQFTDAAGQFKGWINSRSTPLAFTGVFGGADANGYQPVAFSVPTLGVTGLAEHSPYDAAHGAPQDGAYTLVAVDRTAAIPLSAAITLQLSRGALRFNGVTGDGRKVSAVSYLLSGGEAPLYIANLSAGHLQTLSGVLLISATGAAPQISGDLLWNVPGGADPHLPGAGLNHSYAALGARYTPAKTGAGMLSFPNGMATISAAVPSQSAVVTKTGPVGRLEIAQVSPFTLSLTPARGYFYGYDRVGTRVLRVCGVTLQGASLNYGEGFVLDSTAIGSVSISP